KTHLFSHNPGNPFIFIVTLFLTISEISLIPDALSTFGYYVPRTFVMRLWFASDFAISLLIIGYCLYFRLSDHNNTNRFMVIALVGAVLIAKIIPANQGLTYFRQSPYLYWFSNILVVITLISLILVTIEEHSSDEVIGHLALFFLELGRHFLSCFNGNISFYVCNGLYLVGMLFFLIMVIRKTFRL
ncbi:MAG: hypothetical protein HUK24_04995, partial [Sphaerochaetaceae bacterium]|nr:hypothetical protein [Sphaerochaetaceae bacterium]